MNKQKNQSHSESTVLDLGVKSLRSRTELNRGEADEEILKSIIISFVRIKGAIY